MIQATINNYIYPLTLIFVEGGIPEFEPFTRYNKFDDSGVNFNIVLRANEFGNQISP